MSRWFRSSRGGMPVPLRRSPRSTRSASRRSTPAQAFWHAPDQRHQASEATGAGQRSLKRLLAERDLEVDVLKDIAAGNSGAATVAGRGPRNGRGLSATACVPFSAFPAPPWPMSRRCRARMPRDRRHEGPVGSIPALPATRRIRIFLRRQGHPMSLERCHRLCGGRLQVPCKRPRRRLKGGRPRPLSRWREPGLGYDFVFILCQRQTLSA